VLQTALWAARPADNKSAVSGLEATTLGMLTAVVQCLGDGVVGVDGTSCATWDATLPADVASTRCVELAAARVRHQVLYDALAAVHTQLA
jgi:hypothetical protein